MAATPSAITNTPPVPPTPRFAGDACRHRSTRKLRHNTSRPLGSAQTPPPDTENPQSPALQRPPSPHSSGIPPHSPPSSTHTSPRKRPGKAKKPRISSKMDDQTMLDDKPLNSQGVKQGGQNNGQALGQTAQHMLPTPASLPRKKEVPRREVDAAARVLFPPRPNTIEDAMPTPRKNRRGRKKAGFSLYSSMEDDGDDQVQIYTDSRDKVPELDINEDNPFLDSAHGGLPSQQRESRRAGRKRKQPHVESNEQIERAFHHDKGIVYVFRGKKVYKQFPQDSDSEREDSPTMCNPSRSTMNDPDMSRLRPLTRASIKPRLLFPTTQEDVESTAAALADEDATTDFEEGISHQPSKAVTPVKKSCGPATPPNTGHATRSFTQKLRDEAHSPQDQHMADTDSHEPNPKKKISPFNGWSRTKPGVGAPKGRKRDAGEMGKSGVDEAKRLRSGT